MRELGCGRARGGLEETECVQRLDVVADRRGATADEMGDIGLLETLAEHRRGVEDRARVRMQPRDPLRDELADAGRYQVALQDHRGVVAREPVRLEAARRVTQDLFEKEWISASSLLQLAY